MYPSARRPTSIPTSFLYWPEAVRILSVLLAPLEEFERHSDPSDMIAAAEIAAQTSAIAGSPFGDLGLVPASLWMLGQGARFVMPTCTFPSEYGSRFAPPNSYGVFYAGCDRATAIAESAYHFVRRRRELGSYAVEADFGADMRVLVADIQATVTDLRGQRANFPDLYDLHNYSAAQTFGSELHAAGASGISYDSVRQSTGECIAVFHPVCIHSCLDAGTITYDWDGTQLTVR
ncbi:MAG: RES family NAD+ phosphorylase [Gemmatimonadaceae bacterium]